MGNMMNAQESFAAVLGAVLGDAVDPQAAWDVVSKMNDASEMHVNQTLKMARKGARTAVRGARVGRDVALTVGSVSPKSRSFKRVTDKIADDVVKSGSVGVPGKVPNKKEIRTGQALNVVATAGGLHAAYLTGKEIRRTAKTGVQIGRHAKPEKIGRVVTAARKIGGPVGSIARNPKKLALATLGGWGVLHTGELAGDAIAARALNNQSKVAKFEAQEMLAPILAARKDGVITSSQAINMAEEIAKRFSATKGGPVAGSYRAGRAVARKVTGKPFLGGPSESAYRSSMKTASRAGVRNLAILGGAGALAAGAVALSRPKQPVAKDYSPDMEWSAEISKVDEDKRQVFGWASLTSIDGQPVVDRQGDYIPLDEIEKAAYHYVLSSRKGGDMHARDGEGPKHTADLIESFLVTPEKLKHMGLAEDALPHGWWIGMKVQDDDQWEMVKKQERTGFSIHGKGSRIEKDL